MMCKMMISPGFKILIFQAVRGGRGEGGGLKRQKMDKMLVGLKCKKCPKMIKWCLSHCISQEARITRLWFLVHMCKMMTSPDFFFHFFKILIFWIVRGIKGQKWPKMTKNDVHLSMYTPQELYLMWLCFLVHV